MTAIIEKVNQFLSGFCGFLMLGMMLLLMADIVFRACGIPLQGMAELSVFVMIIVIYLGLARCEQHGEHVSLELVSNALPGRVRHVVVIIAQLLAIATIAILLYAVFQNTLDSYANNESLEGTLGLRIWPVKALMVCGLVCFLLQAGSNLVKLLKNNRVA